MPNNIVAIILGAGRSKRMHGVDKLWYEVNKTPLIIKTIVQFLNILAIHKIIIVVNKNKINKLKQEIDNSNLINNKNINKIQIISGGYKRQDSVKNALGVAQDAAFYLVHDAARPFVSKKIIKKVIKNLEVHKAVVPTIKIYDAIKKIKGKSIIKNIEKENIVLAQTPQGFEGKTLRKAYKVHSEKEAADCSSLVLMLGEKIKIISGEHKNQKITVQEHLNYFK